MRPVYSLIVEITPDQRIPALAELVSHFPKVESSGDDLTRTFPYAVFVRYRATDDADAIRQAERAISGDQRAEVHTGYGVHRRKVAEQ